MEKLGFGIFLSFKKKRNTFKQVVEISVLVFGQIVQIIVTGL